jgi:hypothetical protein
LAPFPGGYVAVYFPFFLPMATPTRPFLIDCHSAFGCEVRDLLARDPLFCASTTFREQIYHACRILRQRKPPVIWSYIAAMAQICTGTLAHHCKWYRLNGNMVGTAGRPSVLTPEQMTELVFMIHVSYQKQKPLRLHEVAELVELNWHIEVNANTLHHILRRDLRIRPCKGLPMEALRMQVTPQEISDYFGVLMRTVNGMPSHFVFNMDEMGHETWADSGASVCYVPSSDPRDVVYYPVPRNGRRITLIACISADGGFIRPAMIVARKTFEDEIKLMGYTSDKIEIYSQERSFIDIDIFEDWFKDTFIPDLLKRRSIYHYAGPAVLIMDNCTAHRGQVFQDLCRQHHVLVVFLPPHSSNQLQMLDLCIFGVTKRIIRRMNRVLDVNQQTDHLVKIIESFLRACIPRNIVSSFKKAGISQVLYGDDVLLCHVTPETATSLITGITEPNEFDLEQDDDDEDETYVDGLDAIEHEGHNTDINLLYETEEVVIA